LAASTGEKPPMHAQTFSGIPPTPIVPDEPSSVSTPHILLPGHHLVVPHHLTPFNQVPVVLRVEHRAVDVVSRKISDRILGLPKS